MIEARELAAADVAARLKAFHAEPARFGPRYLDGSEAMPDGGLVIRFAQGKFPAQFAARLAPPEAAALRDAAEEFVRRVCLWERCDHYQALCARRDAPYEAIKENYHLLMALLHPDRQDGGADAWPEACAQRVNLAYAALGHEASRREYDARLRSERPRRHASAQAATLVARRRSNEVRFAKSLMVVSAIVAALVVIAVLVEGDEGEHSVLQSAVARLGSQGPVANRPRYVGATALAPSQRASDAGSDDGEAFAFLRPLLRAITAEEAKPWVPPPRIEAPARAVETASVEPVRIETPVAPAAAPMNLHVAQSTAVAPTPVAAPRSTSEIARPSNQEIESLVVALIAYYEAGDTDRLIELLDPSTGYWRTAQARQAYSDFFRATRARRLRVERLAWNATAPGSAKAKGEATVLAEYFDRSAPVERRVEVELDIVLRDGQPRISRLSLFPDAR